MRNISKKERAETSQTKRKKRLAYLDSNGENIFFISRHISKQRDLKHKQLCIEKRKLEQDLEREKGKIERSQKAHDSEY